MERSKNIITTNIMPSVSKLHLTFLLICFVIQSYGPQSIIVIVVFQTLNLILVAFTTSKWRWHSWTNINFLLLTNDIITIIIKRNRLWKLSDHQEENVLIFFQILNYFLKEYMEIRLNNNVCAYWGWKG